MESMRSQGGHRRGACGIACGAWVLLALLSGSCSEETTAPYCAPERIAVLEGYVFVTGRPVEVTIAARHFENPGRVVATTRSNAAGWYRLEMNPGAYRLEIYSLVDGGSSSFSLRDTVRVAAGTRRRDVRLGSVTVRITTPPELEGRFMSCSLEPLTGFTLREAAFARDGMLEYEFPMVQSNVYRIRIGNNFWLPGTTDGESATRVPVPANHPVVQTGSLNDYATISGNITGSWQQQTSGFSPLVEAYALDTNQLAASGVNSDGTYKLEFLVVQPVKILIDFIGIKQWIGGDSFESATVFALQPGEHRRDVSSIEGGILCRLEGPAFLTYRRARVSLRDSRGRTFEAQSTELNPIPLCNLPPESYTMHVYGYCDYDGEPWADQWYDGADSLAAATVIDVAAGQLVPITVHLNEGASIEGRLLAAGGEPVNSFMVAVDEQGRFLCEDYRYTRSRTFAWRGLNNGRYRIAARPSSRLTWWYPGTSNIDSARVIEIRDRRSVTGIEWRLPPTNAVATP